MVYHIRDILFPANLILPRREPNTQEAQLMTCDPNPINTSIGPDLVVRVSEALVHLLQPQVSVSACSHMGGGGGGGGCLRRPHLIF